MNNSEEAYKKYYKTLQPCISPALNEAVYFNADGLHHLLYDEKKRRPRNAAERQNRLVLLQYVRGVIASATQAVKLVKSQYPLVVTWSLTHDVIGPGGQMLPIKVVVIRKGSRRLYFLSVMCKRKIDYKKKGLFAFLRGLVAKNPKP